MRERERGRLRRGRRGKVPDLPCGSQGPNAKGQLKRSSSILILVYSVPFMAKIGNLGKADSSRY